MPATATLEKHHTPLADVRHRVVPGQPLPFNVYRPDTTLLLARGQVVQTQAQLQALFDRGSLVDLREVQAESSPDVAHAPREALPRLWRVGMDRIGEVLRDPGHEHFHAALDEAARPLQALIQRDPDLAIFQVLRQEGNPHVQYGLAHAVHAGIVAHLVSQRLGWDNEELPRAFKAALTMNVAMFELQGILAEQTTPLTDAQRQQIREHPRRGRALLEMAGVTDRT